MLETIECDRSIPPAFTFGAVPDSTSALSAEPMMPGTRLVRTHRPQLEYRCWYYFDVELIRPLYRCVITTRTLLEQSYLDAFSFEGKGTSAPLALSIVWPDEDREAPPVAAPAPMPVPAPVTVPALGKAKARRAKSAQELLTEIRRVSRLTLEEIAPLAGVTRRSLQHWLAGNAISARKELRLRDLAATLRAVDQADPEALRARLFQHPPHGLRPYDLLREGSFEAAYRALTGAAMSADVVSR